MITHGHTKLNWKSKTYSVWDSMIQRCNNPKATKYNNYGGRGITHDPSWFKFVNFLKDMGERPEGLTLDRIDNEKGYCKENCRWASYEEQNRNTRTNKFITHNGITKTNQEWANELGFPSSTLYNRVFTRGWSVEESFKIPIRFKRKNND